MYSRARSALAGVDLGGDHDALAAVARGRREINRRDAERRAELDDVPGAELRASV